MSFATEYAGARRPWNIATEPCSLPPIGPEEQRLIDMCLGCKRPKCTNCIGHGGTGRRPFVPKKYNVEKVGRALERCQSVSALSRELGVSWVVANRWAQKWREENG